MKKLQQKGEEEQVEWLVKHLKEQPKQRPTGLVYSAERTDVDEETEEQKNMSLGKGMPSWTFIVILDRALLW